MPKKRPTGIQVYLSDEIKAKVKVKALMEDRSESKIVKLIIEQYFKEQES